MVDNVKHTYLLFESNKKDYLCFYLDNLCKLIICDKYCNSCIMKADKQYNKRPFKILQPKQKGAEMSLEDNRTQHLIQNQQVLNIQNSVIKSNQQKWLQPAVQLKGGNVIQCTSSYTLLITGAANWAVTRADAHAVVGYVAGATIVNEKFLQGGGYVVVIQVAGTNIGNVRTATRNVNGHRVTVQAGNHIGDYF